MKTKFGSGLPQSSWIQRSERKDPHPELPFSDADLPDSKTAWRVYGFLLFLCFLIGVFS